MFTNRDSESLSSPEDVGIVIRTAAPALFTLGRNVDIHVAEVFGGVVTCACWTRLLGNNFGSLISPNCPGSA
jgi:hypothetical protein